MELTINPGNGDRWDQHSKLKDGHEKNAMAVDQPIAGLIKDLKSRGLLDSTLLVFSVEFGRTPFAQGTNGRDHNPQGFSMWLAGGGSKGGTIYGATDEYGYRVVENKLNVHDLHANLLGIDHTRLTYRYSGCDIHLSLRDTAMAIGAVGPLTSNGRSLVHGLFELARSKWLLVAKHRPDFTAGSARKLGSKLTGQGFADALDVHCQWVDR